jgi:hypothetical protein
MTSLMSQLAAKGRVAVLVAGACAVTGVTVAASVAPSFSNVDSETDVVATASPSVEPTEAVVSPSPSEGTEATDETSSTDEASAEASPSASTSPKPCPTDVRNHGEYVSSVAHDKSVTGREHGKAVSEAAHSDCGKTDATDDATETDATESEAPETDATENEDAQGDEGDATGQEHHKKPKAHKHGHKHG